MRRLTAAALCLALAAPAAPAFAQYGMDKNGPKNGATPALPQCARPLGRAAIHEPDHDWWTGLGLSNPEALLKLFALRSGCLRIVDRGAGLAMRNEESALNSSGDLQRGSNIGRGQIAAADFFIVPDIANSNRNSGGSNIGGAFGHFLPGGFGAIAGGLNIKKSEAHTLITLEDARTTEQLYVAEGLAQKSDISFGGGGFAGGWGGWGALAGSSYANTDIGKVISAAYFNAFVDLVHYMQNQQPGAQAAAAPAASQRTTQALNARISPSATARIAYHLAAGASVYPTGQRSGVWMEVDDENGNRAWVPSTMTTSR
ncbi:MAG TPA: SH3 domain-containing protein [Caulobacteraceae bacterium]|jgi:curli biogenesis system outer membrane secretion channel CsgG|nr:SH3 domain-containing protein [Caulobacteraceae bacterium]